MSTFTTLAEPFQYDAEPIKGSHFSAWVHPIASLDEALDVVEQARARWPDASHHCWGARLRSDEHRVSDDGEPGGSAGRPILAMIDGHDVVDVCVVVARWFGGTKLGVGGLIRAYGGTAGKALDAAPLVQRRDRAKLVVGHSYDDTNAVAAALASVASAEVTDTQWGASVTVHVGVDVEDEAELVEALADRTRGRAEVS